MEKKKKSTKTVKTTKTSKKGKKTTKANKTTRAAKSIKTTKTTKKELSAKDRKKVSGGNGPSHFVPIYPGGSALNKSRLPIMIGNSSRRQYFASEEEAIQYLLDRGYSRYEAGKLIHAVLVEITEDCN